MEHNQQRRTFLKQLAVSVGALALAPVVKLQQVFAAHVDLKSPLVTALGYVEDAKDSKDRKDKKANCANCNFYLDEGKKGLKTAPCQLMANAEVNGTGWCKSWAAKAKKKA